MTSGAEAYLLGQVEVALDGFANSVGAHLVSGLMLDLGARSARIEHVFIDRFGLLVIDVQARPSTKVKGATTSKTWSASVSRGAREHFGNPLTANKSRVALLKEALLVCGRRIPDEYFSDIVVFAGADLEGVRLDDQSRGRIVEARELRAAMQGRHDFAINAGILEPHEIADMASLLKTLDRSDDPQTRLRHETTTQARIRLPFLRKPQVQVALSNDAAGIAPAAPRLISDRYPDAPSQTLKPRQSQASSVALLAILAAVAVWLFMYGGLSIAQSQVQRILSGQSVSTPIPPEYSPTPVFSMSPEGLENAKSVLRTNAPDVYEQIQQPDQPEVLSSAEYTSYTWHYTADRGSEAGTNQWIALTFDNAGILRAVDQK